MRRGLAGPAMMSASDDAEGMHGATATVDAAAYGRVALGLPVDNPAL